MNRHEHQIQRVIEDLSAMRAAMVMAGHGQTPSPADYARWFVLCDRLSVILSTGSKDPAPFGDGETPRAVSIPRDVAVRLDSLLSALLHHYTTLEKLGERAEAELLITAVRYAYERQPLTAAGSSREDELLAALKELLAYRNCCCDFERGNPMMGGHSPACARAQRAVAKAEAAAGSSREVDDEVCSVSKEGDGICSVSPTLRRVTSNQGEETCPDCGAIDCQVPRPHHFATMIDHPLPASVAMDQSAEGAAGSSAPPQEWQPTHDEQVVIRRALADYLDNNPDGSRWARRNEHIDAARELFEQMPKVRVGYPPTVDAPPPGSDRSPEPERPWCVTHQDWASASCREAGHRLESAADRDRATKAANPER